MEFFRRRVGKVPDAENKNKNKQPSVFQGMKERGNMEYLWDWKKPKMPGV